MAIVTVWHGTDHELYELRRAVEHWCTCTVIVGHVGNGAVPKTCAAHAMLIEQKTLNHLAFVVRNVGRYKKAEFDPRSEFGL